MQIDTEKALELCDCIYINAVSSWLWHRLLLFPTAVRRALLLASAQQLYTQCAHASCASAPGPRCRGRPSQMVQIARQSHALTRTAGTRRSRCQPDFPVSCRSVVGLFSVGCRFVVRLSVGCLVVGRLRVGCGLVFGRLSGGCRFVVAWLSVD